MENKQKAIEKAYGEHWETVKNYVDENGNIQLGYCGANGIDDAKFVVVNSYGLNFENGIYTNSDSYGEGFGFWRPRSLQGIETNNGWIKIESEDDLPKDDSVNYDMYNKNGRAISDLPLKTIIQLFEKGIITHYAIHVQRKPPIY